jgi:hypothetical protein
VPSNRPGGRLSPQTHRHQELSAYVRGAGEWAFSRPKLHSVFTAILGVAKKPRRNPKAAPKVAARRPDDRSVRYSCYGGSVSKFIANQAGLLTRRKKGETLFGSRLLPQLIYPRRILMRFVFTESYILHDATRTTLQMYALSVPND